MRKFRYTLAAVLALILSALRVSAQDVTVTVTPTQSVLPPQVMLYITEPANYFNISLSNTGSDAANVYLVMQVEQISPASTLSLSTPPRRQPAMPIVVPAGGTRILTPGEMRGLFNHIPLREIQAPDNLFDSYADGSFGLLPEGQYELHMTAYRWDPNLVDPVVASSPMGGVAFFNVCYKAQAPEFITPMPGNLVNPLASSVGEIDPLSPIFTWKAPVIVCNPALIQYTYSIRIVEVLPGQAPDNSMDMNPVVYQVSNLSSAMCMVPQPVIKQMSDTKTYAAQVTATPSNSNNRMLNYVSIENSGKSTYCLFRLKGSQPAPGEEKAEEEKEDEDVKQKDDPQKENGDDKAKEDDDEESNNDDDFDMGLAFGNVSGSGEITDSLYNFTNPRLREPMFRSDAGARKIFETSDIFVEWLRPQYKSGEGLRNDTIQIEYDLELFDNGERANKEEAVLTEPVYKLHTKSLKDTIKWEKIKEKVEAGDYMVLRVTPIVKKGESVSFSGTDNIIDFAIARRLSKEYFQCQNRVEIEITTPTNKSAEDLKGETVAIGEYRLTIDEIDGNGADGFSGKGRVEWNPFGSSIMVCVKFEKLKINTQDVVYEGIAEAEKAPEMLSSSQVVDNLFSEWGIDNLIGDSGIPYAKELQNKADGAVKSLAEQINLADYYKKLQDGKDLYKLITTGKMDKLYMPVRFPAEAFQKEDFNAVDLQIASMEFAPTYATMNIIGQATMPECDVLKSKILLFGAPRVCISPDSFLPEDGHVALLGDFTITPSGETEITFKAPNDLLEPRDGCYISWFKGKLELLGIDAEMKFEGVVKDVDGQPSKERPIFHMAASIGSWDDFLVDDISIEDFQLEDLPGYTFSAKNVSYDHSIYRNSPYKVAFPEKYSKKDADCAGADEMWQGLCIGKLGVAFPTSLKLGEKSDSGDYRLWVGAEALFIDKSGITVKMGAENIFQGKTGTLGGWGISLDKARLEIIQDQFENCMFAGQINIPIFESENKDKKKFGNVDYTCEIRRLTDPRKNKEGKKERQRYSYVFLTEQVDDLNFNCFFAKATLDKDQTYFVVEAYDDEKVEGKTNTQVELCLGGTLGIGLVDDANEWLKEKTKGLPIEVKLPDIHFTKMRLSNVKRGAWTFTSERVQKKIKTREAREAEEAKKSLLTLIHSDEMKLGESCYLDLGEWSLASAKKRLGPFSFNLKKFTPEYKDNRINIEVEGAVGLCEDKINVDGAIAISCELKKGDSLTDWSIGDGEVKFRKLELDLDFTALHLNGSLEAKDEGGNKGYQGKLDISITGMFTVNCKGGYFEHEPDENSKELMKEEDPESSKLSDDDRKYAWGYFMVQIESGAGIHADPVVINRISGGFFFNCRPTQGSGENKFTGDPVAEYGMIGVALGIGLSTTAGEQALNADLDLLVVYDRKNSCLSTFMFNGNVKAVSGIIKAKCSLVYENQKNNAGVTQERYLVLNVTVEAGMDTQGIKAQLEKANAALASLKGTLDKFQGQIDGVYKQVSSSMCGMKGLKDDEEIPDDAAPEDTGDESPSANSGKAEAKSPGFEAGKTVISLEFKVTWTRGGVTYNTPKWHLYLGEPEVDKRCSFTLLKYDGKLVKVDIGANAYICLGNELPNNGELPPIPAEITSFLSGNKSSTTDMNADLGKAERSRSAAAKAMLNPNSCNGGVMVGACAWGKIDVDLGLLYGKMGAIAGFDAALVNYGSGAFCMNSGSPMGKNGWYAMGQLYAYLYAELGVRIRIGKLINKDWSFFDFGIGGVLEVGLPNPTWVEGQARVKLSLLGGLWKINKKFSFSAGEYCKPFLGNALDGFEMFHGVSHGSDSLYQALMDPTFAISASDANRMTFTTQSSIGSHYRLEDPNAVNDLHEQTGASKDSLGLHASRTYVFDIDQNLNENNMKMGVRLFDLGIGPTSWIKTNGGPLSVNVFNSKMGRTDKATKYSNMRQMVASYFDNRSSTVCETSMRHDSRNLKSKQLGYLKEDFSSMVEDLLNIEYDKKLDVGIVQKNETDVSFRESKGSTFHLTGMKLEPGHSYALFLMADAYEIENGYRVWCDYVDEGKKNHIHWKQTKAWFFRVKSEEEDKIIGDSIRSLEPYVALAYPSIDGTRVRDDRGEGIIPAYITDIMHPTIALNRDLSLTLYTSKMEWKLSAVVDGDTVTQTRSAKYVWNDKCLNLEPSSPFDRFSEFDNKVRAAADANKSYDYSKELYHLQLDYTYKTTHWDEVNLGQKTVHLVDLWLTSLPHDVTVAGYNTKQDDSWRQTTTRENTELLPYSYPFVGATTQHNPTLAYEKDYKNLTDEEIVFKNKKFSGKDMDNNTVSIPYRLVDPYLYFAYLSKWVFIGDRAIEKYAFDDCAIPYGSESLIFNYNGTVVNGEFLKDVKNKSLVDLRKQMYNVWNDWWYNDTNMPEYPLPLTAKTVGGVTVSNQDGKCSTVTPLNINHYKDMTYCFQDLVQDFIAPNKLASQLSTELMFAADHLAGLLHCHYYFSEEDKKQNRKYDFDGKLDADILEWNKLHRGQYLSLKSRGFEVKVPYYQLPLIYGDCFGGHGYYNGMGLSNKNRSFKYSIGQNDMESGDDETSNLSMRWPSDVSNLLFFRLTKKADGSYKVFDKYPAEMYLGGKNAEYSDSYKGTTYPWSHQVKWDKFELEASLKAVTKFMARLYRVDSYNLETGLYTVSGCGGGPWYEEVTIDANNATAGDMADMNQAIIAKEKYLRTHYDRPRVQVFRLKDGDGEKLWFLYSDSIYAKMDDRIDDWVEEEEIEGHAWKSRAKYFTKIEFDKSMKSADLRNISGWFWGCVNVTTVVGAENLNTKNVTDMSNLFYNCPKITKLDLSAWNTGKVKNMRQMFAHCGGLTQLSQNFNTSDVEEMGGMFLNCSSLTSASLDNFNGRSLTSTASMFYGCSSLKTVSLKGIEGSKLTATSKMFAGCKALKNLYINSFTPSEENIDSNSKCSEMFTEVPSSLYSEVSYDLIDRIRDQIPGNKKQAYNDNYKVIYALNNSGEGTLLFINDGGTYNVNNTSYITACGKSGLYTVKKVWKGENVMNTSTVSAQKVPWNSLAKQVINVYIDQNFKQSPASTAYWFADLKQVQTIKGLENLRTHRVTCMDGMFQNCEKIEELDLCGYKSNFKTANVTSMKSMFSGCKALRTLNIRYMNTAQVTNMASMFSECACLTELSTTWDYVGSEYQVLFSTSNVTNMSRMFAGCTNLKRFTAESWRDITFETSKVTDMSYMFSDCSNYVGTLGSNFDMTSVKNAHGMFYRNAKRESIYLVNTGNLTDTGFMFFNCSSLEEINMQTSTFPKVTDASSMFKGAHYSVYIYIPYDANEKVLNECKDFPNRVLIYPAYAIKYKVGGNYELRFFGSEINYKEGDKYNGYTIEKVWSGTSVMDVKSIPAWVSFSDDVINVTIEPSFKNVPLVNCQSYFLNMKKLKSITGLQYMNVKNAQDLSYMFSGCVSLTDLNLSSWDTSSAKDMSWMFYNCKSLKTLNISNFKTSNVTDMSWMFYMCSSLTGVNLKSFNTEQVTNMNMMFSGCDALTSLDLSSFRTPKLKDGFGMFSCRNLRSLDISKFDFSKLPIVDFSGMASLEELDLLNANTENMEYFTISGDKSLRKLTLGSLFAVDKLTKDDLIPTLTDVHDLVVVCPEASLETIKTAFTEKLGFVIGTTGDFYDKMPDKLAQAIYTADDKTLTFIYSAPVGSNFNGKKVSAKWTGNLVLKPISSYPSWYANSGVINTVVFEPSFASASPTSTKAWFRSFTALKEIKGIENLSTSEVTDMSYMFYQCSKLKDIDLSHFSTSKVKDMSYMFYQVSSLTDIDLSKFNTSNVTNMSYMFAENKAIKSLDLSSFNTASVTAADNLFNSSSSLKTLRLGQNFTLPKLAQKANNCFNKMTDCEVEVHSNYMANVKSAVKGKLGFVEGTNGEFVEYDKKTAQVVWTSSNSTLTFYYGKQLKVGGKFNGKNISAVWSGTDVTSTPYPDNHVPWNSKVKDYVKEVHFDETFAQVRPRNMACWFYECKELTTISGVENLNTSEVMSMFCVCYNCSKLTTFDVSKFDTKKVTNMSYAFSGCEMLAQLDISQWNTSKVTGMRYMFNKCKKLTQIDPSKWDTGKVISFASMFYFCENLTSLDLSKWNTVNATDMSYMFYGCSKLSDLKVSNFDTSKVTSMKGMFGYCTFRNTPYYSFNTKSCTDMSYMFYNCSKMENFFVGNNFKNNTTNVTDMSYMFSGCSTLNSMSDFKTPSVTNMAHMFDGCSKVTGFFIISGFDTSKVTDMSYMFRNCSTSTYFPVDKWNTGKVTTMLAMFYNCAKTTTFSVSNWNTGNVTNMSYMFAGCTSLGPSASWQFSVSKWNVSKVKTFYNMFGETNLKEIDLNGWNPAACTDYSYMFYKNYNLQKVTLGQNFKPSSSAANNSPFSGVSGCSLYINMTSQSQAKSAKDRLKFTKSSGKAYYKPSTTYVEIQ